MPRLSSIDIEDHAYLSLPSIKWYSEATNHKGLARGGIYLLSGPPGSGKTTLALEMMVDLASCGHKVLYVTLEQAPGWLKSTVENRILPHRKSQTLISVSNKRGKPSDWKDQLKNLSDNLKMDKAVKGSEDRIVDNFFIDSSVPNMDALSDF